MRFQVPQFIDVEDKIFGPFTFKQFVYLLGGGGISFVLFKILPLFVAVIFIAPIVGLSLGLAFYKVNNKPFIRVLEAGFKYGVKPKLYVWHKKERKAVAKEDKEKEEAQIKIPALSESKLTDIAWSLGVKESIYSDQKVE